MNDLEFFISFSIIMMLLSFISERLSNFLKLYFQGKEIWIFFPNKLPSLDGKDKIQRRAYIKEIRPNSSKYLVPWTRWSLGLVGRIKLLAKKQPTSTAEKEREYRVMTINIIVGIIVATISNGNFFEISEAISNVATESNDRLQILPGWDLDTIQDKIWPHVIGAAYLIFILWSISLMFFNRLLEVDTKISQQKIRRPFFILLIITVITLIVVLIIDKEKNGNFVFNILYHCIGFVITGLFLSLGSKFWHDLLDILFKYKNVRQRANERSTYTDYDSPEKIMALTNTSHYQVAEELFKEYEDEIWKIKDVVSVGLKSRLDDIDGFFRKKIEVEYTSSKAQESLSELLRKGSITIEMNHFYLRDYLIPVYTSSLESAFPVNQNVATANTASIIKTDKPICYAYNMKSPNSVGSFGVYEANGKYYAQSNLHVFASPTDLKRFSWQNVKNLKDEFVCLIIANKKHENRKIVDFKFGNQGTYGKDYCTCEITSQIYEEYIRLIKEEELLSKVDPETMKMFGAVSKEMSFKKYRETTRCRVNYGFFIEELNLIKIESKDLNIQSGDSGSIVSYEVYGIGGKLFSKQGIIVAKSDKYAYMSKL